MAVAAAGNQVRTASNADVVTGKIPILLRTAVLYSVPGHINVPVTQRVSVN